MRTGQYICEDLSSLNGCRGRQSWTTHVETRRAGLPRRRDNRRPISDEPSSAAEAAAAGCRREGAGPARGHGTGDTVAAACRRAAGTQRRRVRILLLLRRRRHHRDGLWRKGKPRQETGEKNRRHDARSVEMRNRIWRDSK